VFRFLLLHRIGERVQDGHPCGFAWPNAPYLPTGVGRRAALSDRGECLYSARAS